MSAKLKKVLCRNAKGLELFGSALDDLSTCIVALNPASSAALTAGTATSILGKLFKYSSNAITKISGNAPLIAELLDTPSKIGEVRHLLIQNAYITALLEEIDSLPLRSADSEVSPDSFKLLSGDPPPAILGNITLTELSGESRAFEPYQDRLKALIHSLCIIVSEKDAHIAKIAKRAKTLAIQAIESVPILTQPFYINSIKRIENTTRKTDQSIEQIIEILGNPKSKPVNFRANGPISTQKSNTANEEIGMAAKIDYLFKLARAEQGHERISDNLPANLIELFESGREELQSGNLNLAFERFRAILKLLPTSADPEIQNLRARSTSNIGIVYYTQQDFERAIQYFNDAHQICPDHPNLIGLRGLALDLQGKTKDAIEFLSEAVSNHKNHDAIILPLAQLIGKQSGAADGLRLLDKYPANTESWFEARAGFLCALNQFEEAKTICKRALERWPESVHLKIALATAIAAPLTSRPLIDLQFRSADETTELKYAENLFADASNTLRERNRTAELVDVIANHTVVLIALGEFEDAKQKISIARNHRGYNLRFKELLLSVEWLLGNDKRALEIAEDLYKSDTSDETRLKLCALLCSRGSPEKALEIIDERLKQGAASSQIIRYKILRLDALTQAHKRLQADSFVKELEADHPEDTIVIAALAKFYRDRRLPDKAELYLRKALKLVSEEHERLTLGIELSELLYTQGRWEASLDAFPLELVSNNSRVLLSQRAHCSLEVGNLEEAFRLATSVPREEATESVLEIRSWLEQKLFKYNDCRETLNELSHRNRTPRWSLQLADTLSRSGKRDEAYGILRDLIDANPDDDDVAVAVSQACYQNGLNQEGFSFARDALRRNPKNQHLKLLVSRVLLLGEGAISLSEEDKEILHESLVDNDYLRRIEIPISTEGQADISPILNEVRESDIWRKNAIREYIKAKAPLGFLIPGVFTDVWSAWRYMTKSNDGRIFMAIGDQTSQKAQLDSAISCNRIVVDFSALVTLAGLGKLDLLRKFGAELIIPSETVDILQNARDMTIGLKPSSGSLAHDDGRFVFSEVKECLIDAEIDLLGEILEFISGQSVRLEGLEPSVFSVWERDKELRQLPISVFLPVGVSCSYDAPLYSDQVVVGALATERSQQCSFCTQDFLRACCARGLISENEYEDAVIWLIRSNYEFVSIGVETILSAVCFDGFVYGPTLRVVLDRSASVSSISPTTSAILAGAATQIWTMSSIHADERCRIVVELARTAGVFSGSRELCYAFIGRIVGTFAAVPGIAMGLLDTLRERVAQETDCGPAFSIVQRGVCKAQLEAVQRGRVFWFPNVEGWEKQHAVEQFLKFLRPRSTGRNRDNVEGRRKIEHSGFHARKRKKRRRKRER